MPKHAIKMQFSGAKNEKTFPSRRAFVCIFARLFQMSCTIRVAVAVESSDFLERLAFAGTNSIKSNIKRCQKDERCTREKLKREKRKAEKIL